MKLNKINTCILLSCVSLSSFANEPKVKLKGGYDFKGAWGHNNGTAKQKLITAQKSDLGFNSSAHMSVEIQDHIQDVIEVGAKIGLETTAKNDRRVSSLIYLISDFGKVELGSDKSVYAKMKITGFANACGTGGDWDGWPTLSSDPSKLSYVSNFGNFIDGKTRDVAKAEYSRKISYYTPTVAGFEFGISYVPDSTNVGYDSITSPIYHKVAKPYPYLFGITDGIAYGLTHKYKISEDANLKTAITGEHGKVKAFNADDKTRILDKKFSNLKTVNVGGLLTVKDYSIGASYMNYLKSFTSPEVDQLSRQTHAYAITGKHVFDQFGISLTYFGSNHKKSKVNNLTLASDYKVMQGLLSYMEFTHYRASGKYLDNGVINKEKLKGNLFIMGFKLEI